MDHRHRGHGLFPDDFLWGASTASHQVEGGTVNQWSVWELARASEAARDAEKNYGDLEIWPHIKAEATKPENYVSGTGVEHYKRYEEDFKLLKQLNLNAFRFGIEWSRIEPQKGLWDETQIEHYHRYIDKLRELEIEPILNIWHWTMPTWFTDLGGFEKYSNIKHFEHFVDRIGQEFGKEVNIIITLNEPNVYTAFSYLDGSWPPQVKSPWRFIKVYWNLTRAHRRAYKILKRYNPKLQVGVAAQLANIQAKRPHNLFDGITTKWMRYFWNWWFLRRVRNHQDFVGLNYYFTDYYTGIGKRLDPKVPRNDLGWYMEPEGLYPLMLRVHARYNKPIIITENGVADMHDDFRRWWIEETIVSIERALSEGVKVIGYLHWSLLDNFEWAYGWWPKFGLIAVDRENGMKRSIRPSAKWYAEKVKRIKDGPIY